MHHVLQLASVEHPRAGPQVKGQVIDRALESRQAHLVLLEVVPHADARRQFISHGAPCLCRQLENPEAIDLFKLGGVDHVVADQCMYGLKTRISGRRRAPGYEAHSICQQQLASASGAFDQVRQEP